ncbi:DUF4234 domain-containing protein [Actinomyces provencensis]|uniref:DUF4234 domain-containing protein n=1 Tax=Actinomyces provencensis TaxID=1720198 RepID=UPI001E449683|nr:DUF4234 domain-containing protein [Actinomyces provencensis]
MAPRPAMPVVPPATAPAPHVASLRTDRSLVMVVLLGLITFGIYPIIVLSEISTSVNTICSRYDARRTMHYCLLVFIVGPLTLGIGTLVWFNNISGRIGNELARRGQPRLLSATDYWMWGVLGALIVVGPFIYLHKLLTAMNALSADYNARG